MATFLDPSWGNIEWTPWFAFTRKELFRYLPQLPGMYRVRAVDGQELFYVGQTGRDLRARLGALRSNTMKPVMPFNDPHTAAASLWAWRNAEGLEFECSVAPVKLAEDKEEARRLREGLEFYLLWQYRLEYGSSTRCNHGRFHPRYVKSSDRKQGRIGYRLPADAPDNVAGGASLPALSLHGAPLDRDWMGQAWSNFFPLSTTRPEQIPAVPGVYKIFDLHNDKLLYLGETGNLRKRFNDHAKKSWRPFAAISYVQLSEMLSYQRHELENDLIGAYYAQTSLVPQAQLVNFR